MNLLLDAPPESVEIDGIEYKINTDFRDCLRSILAFEDSELTSQEKQLVLLANLYPVVPDNIKEAVLQGIMFLDCGNTPSEEERAPAVRLYSMNKDANLIYSAFNQTHGIDLQKVKMHWWIFFSLFMDLKQDTTFSSLIGLRSRLAKGTATKEEKAAAREMGDLVNLEPVDLRTPDEKELEDEFFRKVEEARVRREALKKEVGNG
jgi:hypothetical protein